MSKILNSAKKISQDKKREYDKKRKEMEEEMAKPVKKDPYVLAIRRLLKPINGKDGFKVEFTDNDWGTGIFGEVAVIEHEHVYTNSEGGKETSSEYVGTVCIQTERYMWRGSDESPEQECHAEYLRFRRIVNDDKGAEWEFNITEGEKQRKASLPALESFLEHKLSKYYD